MASHDASPYDELFADAERRSRERRRRRADRDARRPRRTWSPGGATPLTLCAAALAVLTVVGLVAMWPAQPHRRHGAASTGPTSGAKVTAVRDAPCGGATEGACRRIAVRVDGATSTISLGPVRPGVPDLHAGQKIRVAHVPDYGRAVAGGEQWSFVGIDRRGGFALLVVLLAILAVAVVRLRGLLAALGVVLSIGVLLEFAIPALIDGEPALLVALVAAFAVMFVTVLLTHGTSPSSLAAILGIATTLVVTCAVAALAVHLVALDGGSSELAQYLAQEDRRLSLQGIVLAGMVIGALGVLADTAVTQASAVAALRRANPELDARGLYGHAWTIGRDHLAATIHTLVLAYAGASLPLLLLMRSTAVGATDAIDTQDVAEPIAAALVGCIALVVAVPITTALAAALVSRTPASALADEHAHHH